MSSYEKYRKALGLSDDATDAQVEAKYMEAMSRIRARQQQPATPTAQPPSPIVLAEQAALTDLFKKLTEPNPQGITFAESEKMDEVFLRYPHLYEAYRQSATQSG
jgi:hypothetical protein